MTFEVPGDFSLGKKKKKKKRKKKEKREEREKIRRSSPGGQIDASRSGLVHSRRFSLGLNRSLSNANGRTNVRTYGRTDPLIEIRGRI